MDHDHDSSVRTAHRPAPWLTLRGLRREDAPIMFQEAAAFYADLARAFESVPGAWTSDERRAFARSRRAYLHRLLADALLLVDLLEEGRP